MVKIKTLIESLWRFLSRPRSLTVRNKNQLLTVLESARNKQFIQDDIAIMMESLLHFSTLKVRDIMIPRSQMIVIPDNIPTKALLELIGAHRHSRYPVVGDSKDEIIGILHAKDLLLYDTHHADFSLTDILRPHTVVPESKQLMILLKDFRENRNHMAIVVDEYGGVSGFVTIEDVLEQIVGDIEDEFDNDDDSFIKAHNDGSYIIKGHIPMDEFNQFFRTSYDETIYDTLSTLIQKQASNMPHVGDDVVINASHFKILNADSKRIKLVEFVQRSN